MEASKQIRSHDIGPNSAGRLPCPYENCTEDFATGPDRLHHMFLAHRLESEWRLTEIESHLGGPWRERAACLGRDEFVTEPTSRDKATARETGFRHPTKSERRAFAVCAGCKVRRDCAKASLQPPPRHPELPQPRDPIDFEPYGIFCGVPADARKRLVAELGTGQNAVESVLRMGERLAADFPP